MAKFDVSGLSIKDVAHLDKSTLDQLSKSDLSKVTSRLVSAMNKRIRYLGKSEVGQLSPTYQAYERRKKKGIGRDGFYSVKGKDRTELNNLFRQLSKSLTTKTMIEDPEGNQEYVEITTAKGWKKHRQNLLDQLGYNFTNDYEREKKFWELYRKYQEQDATYKHSKYRKDISDKVLTYIINEIGSDYTDSEENIQKIKDKIDQLYEEIKGEENEQETETGTSQFFTDGGNV